MSGTVSYKIDGLEEVLTPNSFDNLNKKMLESHGLKTGQMISTSKEAGKIVNNFECYIATFLESEEARNAEQGKSITLRMTDGTEIDAKIEYIKQEGKEVMLIFKINKYVEELISYRKISIDVIWWGDSGLKIPNSAIVEENDLKYVIRNRTGYKDKILVKILKQNENYSIIEKYTTKELLEKGYKQEEISSMKSISLYDEIITSKNK